MTDVDSTALVDKLQGSKKEIFSLITQENIDVYKYLKDSYNAKKVDDNVFRFVYDSFYMLDKAFLTDEFKDEYFTLLKNGETSLEQVLKKLYDIKIHGGQNKYHLSFATKLVHHTASNNNTPIYDSRIALVIKFPTQRKNESRFELCLRQYELLKQVYAKLLDDGRVKKLIMEFRGQRQNADVDSIGKEKVLDFMLWARGRLEARSKSKK